MQVEDLVALVEKIQNYKCEFQKVEVKAAEQGCPKLYDTLSSFSNQDEGGIIVLGLREKNKEKNERDFAIVGVYDTQDIQQQIASQCRQMEAEVRPLITVAQIEDKFVVGVEVPGVDVSLRPIYYKGAGRNNGSYVRVGDADLKMSDYEIYSYEAFRRSIRDDLRLVEGAEKAHLQQDLLGNYLVQVKATSSNLNKNASDDEILELMGIVKGNIPTITGVLLFGKYPQAYFPQLDITAVVVPGTTVGDLGIEGERFLDNKRINGTIADIFKDAVDFVQRNMRVKTIIASDGTRNDRAELPLGAVREALLNAIVHRDYSIHTEGSPITLCMFNDRLEITNKGGLYGRINIDQLGKVHPETRNPVLANAMEILKLTENRYSGIPTMRREMELAGLPQPEFVAKNGEFKVILRKSKLEEEKISAGDEGKEKTAEFLAGLPEKTKELLKFCKTPRSRAELISFTQKTKFYTMSVIVKPLVDMGILKLTIPDIPRSHKQKYYCDLQF